VLLIGLVLLKCVELDLLRLSALGVTADLASHVVQCAERLHGGIYLLVIEPRALQGETQEL
jgi:hypothetical protein